MVLKRSACNVWKAIIAMVLGMDSFESSFEVIWKG